MIAEVFFPKRSRTFSYHIPEGMPCAKGQRVRAMLQRSKLIGLVVELLDDYDPGYKLRDIEEVLDDGPLLAEEHFALATWLSKVYLTSVERCLATMLPMALEERVGEAPWEEPKAEAEGFDFALSPDQERALAALAPHTKKEEQKLQLSYLYGQTGSGKTEVFLRTAQSYIEAGYGVIYLVPEITLTHQLIEQVQARIFAPVAVLHSGLTPSQRLRGWHRLASGEARLVLGARSAVFAPIQNLGLIIIDEEHEGSYKSEQSPRYHARAVAAERARLHDARLLIGSATPSLEAWKAVREGAMSFLKLERRENQSPAPRIRVVPFEGEQAMITQPLFEAMQETLAQKRQVLLFLNRRGMYSFITCGNCDYEAECLRCSVRMTLHQHQVRGAYLRCHICDERTAPPRVCPSCSALEMQYKSFGTQRIEEDLQRLFADYKMIRLDSDSMRRKGSLERALTRIQKGKVDIIVGTQMIAKGLNFPGVDLVGVLMGDHMLHIPDFRAAEHTIQQLFQVAGRAGRYERQGQVIIQAFSPEAPVFKALIDSDLSGFYDEELRMRSQTHLPPYRRMIRILFTQKLGTQKQSKTIKSEEESKDLSQLASSFEQCIAALHEKHKSDLQELRIVGPIAPLMRFIGGKERLHILLIGDHAGYMRWLVASTMHILAQKEIYMPASTHGLNIEIDVDPLELR